MGRTITALVGPHKTIFKTAEQARWAWIFESMAINWKFESDRFTIDQHTIVIVYGKDNVEHAEQTIGLLPCPIIDNNKILIGRRWQSSTDIGTPICLTRFNGHWHIMPADSSSVSDATIRLWNRIYLAASVQSVYIPPCCLIACLSRLFSC